MEYPHRASTLSTLAVLCLALYPLPGWAQNPPGHIRPTLRLEKPRYLLGEAIRFWVGVDDGGSPIPDELQKPCTLFITTPDGQTEAESVSWPADGQTDRGFSGGWGFGQRQVVAGTYSLVLQCAGKGTEPVKLVVDRNDISTQIMTGFRFLRTGPLRMDDPVPVVLEVANNSPYVIRFPERGAMMEGISISVVRDEPAYRSDFFYPWEKLASTRVMPDIYNWAALSTVPTITLRPGEHFEQRLSLGEAYRIDQSGKYAITFSTTVLTLIGEQTDALADYCPLRLIAAATAHFDVTKTAP
jgi:hypothetical protein